MKWISYLMMVGDTKEYEMLMVQTTSRRDFSRKLRMSSSSGSGLLQDLVSLRLVLLVPTLLRLDRKELTWFGEMF